VVWKNYKPETCIVLTDVVQVWRLMSDELLKYKPETGIVLTCVCASMPLDVGCVIEVQT
jgi:hypothetical protein